MQSLLKSGSFNKVVPWGIMAQSQSLDDWSPLTDISLPARLEAILYLKGKPMTINELTELSHENESAVNQALELLMASYAQRDTALDVQKTNEKYSLQLRAGLSELVQNLLPVDLSLAALRTLATIALKKRILQSELVDIRGSGAYDHIKELLSQNFIERKRQSDGRSFWLTLSDKFHRTFSVVSDISSNTSSKAA